MAKIGPLRWPLAGGKVGLEFTREDTVKPGSCSESAVEVGTVGETSQGIFEGRKEGREGGRGKKESKVRLQARDRLAGGT